MAERTGTQFAPGPGALSTAPVKKALTARENVLNNPHEDQLPQEVQP